MHIELDITLASGSAQYGVIITGDRLEEYKVKSETAVIEQTDAQGRRTSHRYQRDGRQWDGPQGLSPIMDDQSLALTALGGAEPFKALADALSGVAVYSVFPDKLRVPQRFDVSHPMKKHGDNWLSILRKLVRDDSAKDDLIAGLNKLTGDIEDVRVISAAGHLIAEFKHEARAKQGKRWFDASQQSDGTLRVAGLLTALLQSPSVPVVGIEEPELTVHPGALPMLYDYLKQASTVSQVIVTTHSPIMLDLVDHEKDVVFVVNRRDGKTDVRRVDDPQLKPVRDKLLRLGDLFSSGDLQLSLFQDQDER